LPVSKIFNVFISGVVGLIVGFPLDTTKVQMQTAATESDRVRIIDMFKKIRTDGMVSGD
jgi:hypothetical protein